MIDEKKLIKELRKSNYHHASNSREEALLDRVIRIVNEEPKDHDLEWYKHEYYAECERSERLEKALDKACDELASMDYELGMSKNPFAYDCDYKDSDEWKEWLMKDVE